MFFYRYKVSESHLNKYAHWVHSKYLSGKTELIATIGKDIHVHKFFNRPFSQWIYFMVDKTWQEEVKVKKNLPHPALLGFCCMAKIPRWIGLETSMLYVNSDIRGKGIASLLYDAIMKDGVIVISGYSHNQKSRRLWLKLVQNDNYVAWAHDIINLDTYAPVYVEEGTFKCELKLYDDIKKIRRRRRSDVRIIMYNPKYVKDKR